MNSEQRLYALEHEVRTLKSEIQQTLVEIQASLPDKPASPVRWQKKAWVLALLNVLMAVTLFANIYLYLPGSASFAIDTVLSPWLRALWVAIALMWLLLQMYPLALLLEQEDPQWQGIVWRNATTFFRARPGFIVGLTAAVLAVAIVNAVIPMAWLVAALTLFVAVASAAVRHTLDLYRERARANSRG